MIFRFIFAMLVATVSCFNPARAQTVGPFPGVTTASLGAGVWSAAPVALGSGYVPGDTITPTIPGAVVNSILGGNYVGAVLYVGATQVASATVQAGGASCAGGTATLTGTTGTGGVGFYFTATAPISGGAIQNPVTITSGGAYQVPPTTPGAEPVTGSSCVGSQLALTMGVQALSVQNPGSYSSVVNGGTATQASTSGAGSGATFTVNFAAQAAYILPPLNSDKAGIGIPNSALNFCAGYLCNGSMTSGYENTAFGWEGLGSVTAGVQNSAFGKAAGYGLTTGSQNTSIGRYAGRYNATGSNNTAVGSIAATGVNGNSFSGATAVGAQALNGITTATGSTAVGFQALLAVTSGTSNTAVGFQAGKAVTGQNNAMMGANAGAVATGNNSTFVGSSSGLRVVAGANNTLIGELTGSQLTSGAANTFIGAAVASTTAQTGNNNVVIGGNASADTPAGNTSNYAAIFGNSATPWISAVGTNTPTTETLTLHGSTFDLPDLTNAAGNEILCFNSGTGAVTYEPAVATCVPSAMSLKNIAGRIDPKYALQHVAMLTAGVYSYKDTATFGAEKHDGLYADEICAMDEKLCFRNPDGSVANYDKTGVIAYLVASVRELNGEIERLKRAAPRRSR